MDEAVGAERSEEEAEAVGVTGRRKGRRSLPDTRGYRNPRWLSAGVALRELESRAYDGSWGEDTTKRIENLARIVRSALRARCPPVVIPVGEGLYKVVDGKAYRFEPGKRRRSA